MPHTATLCGGLLPPAGHPRHAVCGRLLSGPGHLRVSRGPRARATRCLSLQASCSKKGGGGDTAARSSPPHAQQAALNGRADWRRHAPPPRELLCSEALRPSVRAAGGLASWVALAAGRGSPPMHAAPPRPASFGPSHRHATDPRLPGSSPATSPATYACTPARARMHACAYACLRMPLHCTTLTSLARSGGGPPPAGSCRTAAARP